MNWVTDSLGTASFYEQSGDFFVVDVRDLVDGKGNSGAMLKEKIMIAAEALDRNNKVVVCCDRGLSRSKAIAVGVLMHCGVSYEESLKTVAAEVGAGAMNLDLLHEVRQLDFE